MQRRRGLLRGAMVTGGAILAAIAIAMAAAMVDGCSQVKELPSAASTSKEQAPAPVEPAVKVPGESDPAARAIAERAIKAITLNKPDALVKARQSIAKYRGEIKLPAKPGVPTTTGLVDVEATRVVEASWPDRVRWTYDKNLENPKQTWGLDAPLGWYKKDNEPYIPVPNPSALAQYVRVCIYGEEWLFMGLGYLEPGVILFEPKSDTTATGTIKSIKVAPPALPVFTIWFDDKTDLPVRIEYTQDELVAKVRSQKRVLVLEHVVTNGFMLPARTENYFNGSRGESWTIESWEFPEKFDTTIFDPPLK